MKGLAELGQQIASARKRKRLTQSELAATAMVSRPTIHLLESGRAGEIGYSKLIRILAAVDLELQLQSIASGRPTLDDLLSEEPGE
jgi:transcriptional regulator with XRE-family HTH domain